jgi:uncharacterized SAM-binding protein YcdF (DUF218 family)
VLPKNIGLSLIRSYSSPALWQDLDMIVFLEWRRQSMRGASLKRTTLAAVFGIAALAVLLSMPVVSNEFIDRLQVFPPVAQSELRAATAGPPSAIVILAAGRRGYAPEFGGETVDGLSLERLRYGALLARQTQLPVLVSGGMGRPSVNIPPLAQLMNETLLRDYGIKAKWIEARSRNTAENAIFASSMLKAATISRIVLVTHAWHMPRARAAFVANGMSVIPAPTAFYRSKQESVWFEVIPSMTAIRMSGYAVHEFIGRAWYAVRYGY